MSEITERISNWFKEMLDNQLIRNTAQKQILEMELLNHLQSDKLQEMIKAYKYYKNETDIQEKRVAIDWKSNTKIESGLFNKLVRQKVNYLLTLSPSVTVDKDETGQKILDEVFGPVFQSTLKEVGTEVIVKGVAYTIPFIDEEGELKLFSVPAEQIIPFWSDERRETVDAFMRVYENKIYDEGMIKTEEVVEYWDENGIIYYLLESGHLKIHPHIQPQSHYNFLNSNGDIIGVNWDRIPLIAWRYNKEEESLLKQVKSLIDNFNNQASVNADLLADLPKFTYILKDYGDEDLDTFVKNLNRYFAIKVEGSGDVNPLQVEPQTASAEAEMERTRKMIYEAGSGIDTQDDNLGNASGVALKFRYSDLDLDCNDIENEFQKSINQYLWFVHNHTLTTRKHDIKIDTFKYVFNRDIIINESEAIADANNSRGIIDDKTIRENHPWYTPEVEKRLKEQLEEERTVYGASAFPREEQLKTQNEGDIDDDEQDE